ncbi:MAG: AI-2E family transporter [Hyphomonadaceae bacterium]|nr:AI-2E family transporter [Hyphomonadaceae bacterium]
MARRKRRASGFESIPVREPFLIVEQHPQLVTAICLSIMAALAICVALWAGQAFLLPIAVALVFSVILAPLCSRIEWFRIPRPVAALMALIIAGGIAYLAFSLIAQPAANWMENAPQTIQRAERQLRKLQEPLKPLTDISKEVQDLQIVPEGSAPASRTVVLQQPGLAQSVLASVQTAVVQTGFIFILCYFLLITRGEFRLKLIAFQTTLRDRVRAARVFRDVEKRVSGYIVTFSAINIVVGVGTGIACWQLGLPEPLMWGGLATLFNFVPFLGPAIMMGLLGLAGLATFDTLVEAAFPVLAFMGISFLEANLITPTIVGRRMTLNPLAIILVVSFWIWLWGPIGGVIALPLLIMFKVICDHTPALRVVGALIGSPIIRVARIDNEDIPLTPRPVAASEPTPQPAPPPLVIAPQGLA